MQVGVRKCRHDAGEHHLSMALRTGRTLNRLERHDGRQQIGAYASFEQASVQHSRSPRMSRGPSGNATVCRSGYPLAVQYCSISETCFRFFPAICFPRKRTARLSPAAQVREEMPRGRAATAGGGPSRNPILQIERSRALTRLNFLLTFRVLSGDRSYCCRSRRRDTDTLFSRRNAPTTLIASATNRPRVSASASPSRAAILRSNTIDVP